MTSFASTLDTPAPGSPTTWSGTTTAADSSATRPTPRSTGSSTSWSSTATTALGPCGRQTRRTLAEMDPGYQRQPVLLLARPLTFRSANDACPLCGFWKCRCGGIAPAPAESSGQLQCDQCSGWFGFTGWTCPACKQLQGALPMRPTPHERDGRTEQPPPPARPHTSNPERHRP